MLSTISNKEQTHARMLRSEKEVDEALSEHFEGQKPFVERLSDRREELVTCCECYRREAGIVSTDVRLIVRSVKKQTSFKRCKWPKLAHETINMLQTSIHKIFIDKNLISSRKIENRTKISLNWIFQIKYTCTRPTFRSEKNSTWLKHNVCWTQPRLLNR